MKDTAKHSQERDYSGTSRLDYCRTRSPGAPSCSAFSNKQATTNWLWEPLQPDIEVSQSLQCPICWPKHQQKWLEECYTISNLQRDATFLHCRRASRFHIDELFAYTLCHWKPRSVTKFGILSFRSAERGRSRKLQSVRPKGKNVYEEEIWMN